MPLQRNAQSASEMRGTRAKSETSDAGGGMK